MNVLDYLNSRRGGALLAVYSSILVIFAMLVLAFIVVLDKRDLPANVCFLFGAVIAAGFGVDIAKTKLNSATDGTSNTQPLPPP